MRRLVALAVAGLALAAAAPAHAELKAICGPDTLPDVRSAWPIYHRLGVDVVERQRSWRDVAVSRPAKPRDPNDPAYHWPPALDAALREAGRRGIRIALLVKEVPSWANGGRARNQIPNRPIDYARFVAAASRRYPGVRHWMIWGEPSQPFNFQPLPKDSPVGPRLYAQILDAAYGALKSVSRRNIVIGGMTFTTGRVNPVDWLRWMKVPPPPGSHRSRGRRPRLDWYGHNPFSVRYPQLSKDPYQRGLRDMSDVDTLAGEVRRAYRHKRRPPRLWLSEFTVGSDQRSWAFDFHVSRREQARWLGAAYRIARRKSYIAGLGWFTLQDEPDRRGRPGMKVGLLDTAGRPKPSFAAYRRAR